MAYKFSCRFFVVRAQLDTLTPMNSTTILLLVGCIYTAVGNDKSIAPEDSTLPVNIFDVL